MLVALAVGDAAAATDLLINVNGSAHVGTDFPGSWQADPGAGGVCGPNTYTNGNPIDGTSDDALFQGEVWGNPVVCAAGGGTLDPGEYEVSLYFAEIYFGPGCPGGGGTGSRVFDIVLEGQTVLQDFDIFAGNGCAASTTQSSGSPTVRTFMVDILDGTLDIGLPASANNGKISAIEIHSAAAIPCVVPADCDDGDVCTVDACDEASDSVSHTPDDSACDDALFCNGAETCNAATDCEAGTPPTLDDGVACTVDSCDEAGDQVQNTPDPAACQDADPCTADSRDAIFGCVNDPIPDCTATAVPTGGAPNWLLLALALVATAWRALSRPGGARASQR